MPQGALANRCSPDPSLPTAYSHPAERPVNPRATARRFPRGDHT